jgi:nucleotide-binding universal stress UspA family protein
MTIQHILVPMDFSAYAEQALDYAIGLADKLQARLTLLHVVHIMPLGVAGGEATLPYSYIVDLEEEVQEEMEQYRQRVQDAGLAVDLAIVHGIPFQHIIEVAQDKDVNLIVIGTHGRTGLQHMLLGSVAEKVVRLAPCPVLVARKTANAAGQ